MNRLSEDIFKSIAHNLDFKDKLACIAVCKRWHRMLRRTILFESYVLKGDLTRVKGVMAGFNVRKNTRQQVTSLLIDDCAFDKDCLLLPVQILTNVKRLTWIDTRSEILTPTPLNKQLFRIYKWKFLECLSADALWLYTLDAFGTVFSNLTALSIEFMRVQEARQQQQVLTYFIQNFNNVPALKDLTLYNVNVSLMDMEEIHTRAPHLESLDLIDAYLFTKKYVTLPVLKEGGATISTSYGMRCFKLTTVNEDVKFYEGMSGQLNIVQWFMYFGRKYRDLDTFLITTPFELRALSSYYTLEQPILNTVSIMVNITSYAMTLCPMSFLVLHAMDKNKVQLKNVQLWADKSNIEEIIDAFNKTSQRKHVKFLAITTSNYKESSMEDKDYYQWLITLIGQFDNVKEVYVKYDTLAAYDTTLSVVLLQSLYEFKYLRIGEYEINGTNITITILNGLHTNVLDVNVDCWKVGNHKKVTDVMNIILCAYPYFKIIKVHGNTYCGLGHITFPFKNHSQLEFVDIDLDGLGNYRFKKGQEDKQVQFLDKFTHEVLIDSSLDGDIMFYVNFFWKLDGNSFNIAKESSRQSKKRREE